MTVILRVDVPIASFPTSRSREYRQTYPVPPPSTVYGMLLSLVGETDRYKHCGVKIALALLSEPAKSVTLQTMRRFKNKKIYHKENTRPDFQEILTGIELMIWVDRGEDRATPNLGDRIAEAFADPASVNRFGALCLGESRDLVNSVDLITDSDSNLNLKYLIQDRSGDLSLPYWVDYVGSKDTCWLRYTLENLPQAIPPNLAWTIVKAT
ncbi:MAG: type I-MYXAN CRISPR-associated protein Cas5/Cmx5/DevS [Xenococcaceae cyanobacterium MO_188.B29]|nr:type I-MYXAN CRISPR-associated protein Cas5/Cmx5/DevS [Xenococcaceae cyanobacterium MO_188.B29]